MFPKEIPMTSDPPRRRRPKTFHLSRRADRRPLFFAGYAAAAWSAKSQPIHTDEAGLITETVTLPAADFALPGYVARPKAKGRFPAVLVVSEVFGLHEYIRDICRRLAKLGYVAAAPAFFVRVADPAPLTDIAAVIKIVQQASDQQVMGDIGATLKYLKAQPFVNASKMAVTGFCWGGGVTWLACEEFTDFKAGVAWYGRMVPPPAAGDPARLWPVKLVGPASRPGSGPLRRQGRPGGQCAGHARGPGGGSPDQQRNHRLSGRRPWLPRRLSRQLQRGRRQGRLGQDAGVLRQARREAAGP